MAEKLKVGLFGDLRCTTDGTALALPPGKPTVLFALLALNVGRVVGTSEVIDALWPEDPPQSARALVHTYVSSLRRALKGASPALETVQGGYRLDCPREHIDLHHFLTAGVQDDPEHWTNALAISAHPILNRRDLSFVRPWQQRVDDLRDAIQFRWWQHRVEQGGGDRALVVDLQDAVRTQPLREDVAHLLALALARCGRHDEGIAVLDALRLRLSRELGVDPSPTHAELRSDLLRRARTGPPAVSHSRGGSEPEGEEADQPAGSAGTAPGKARQRWLLVLVGLVVLLSGVLLWRLTLPDGGSQAQLTGPGLVHVSATDGITHVVPLPVRPDELQVGGGTAWVMSASARSVASVTLDGGRAVTSTGLPDAPVSLAAQDDSVVVSLGFTGTVVTVTDDGVSTPRPGVEGASGKLILGSGEGGTWAATVSGQIHPPGGTPGWAGPVQIEEQPMWIRGDGARAWVLTQGSLITSSGGGTPVASAIRGMPADLAVGAGQAWVVTSGDNRIWRADATTERIVQTSILPGRPVAVVVDDRDGRVWVALDEPASIVALDAATLAAGTSVSLPSSPVDLAMLDGDVVVAVRGASSDG